MSAVGIFTLVFFYFDRDSWFIRPFIFHFGTLPPGDYPRIRLTFLNANMLCNYLTVSLCVLFVAARLGWVRKIAFLLLTVALLLTAVFTISPGLGGVFLATGIWLYLSGTARRRARGRFALAAGVAASFLFVFAMAVTPILHPTAPFLIHVPGTELVLAPSGRLMIWMDAVRNFLADPIFGRGIGEDAALVHYLSPSGEHQRLTDAHNTFLSLAVQSGAVGLTAWLALFAHIARRTRPLSLDSSDMGVVRVGLGLALLNGFFYQGLGGSFEDARHLWVLLGLFLAAARLERSVGQGAVRSGQAASRE